MPITAQDLLRMADQAPAAQPQAPQPAQPAEPVMKHGIGQAELRSARPDSANALADAFAEAVPGPAALKGFVRGAAERVAEPVGRLAGAAGYASATGELPPESGPVSLAGDVLQTGYALHPETRLIAAGGAAVQGIAEQLGFTPNSARMLSIAAEAGTGMRGFLRAGTGAAAEGESLLKRGGELRVPVTPSGAPQLTMKERVGADLAGAARTTLVNNKRVLGNAMNRIENQIVGVMPSIQPGTQGYGRLADALATVDDRQIKFPADATSKLEQMRSNIAAGMPISTGDVMDLRTRLRQLTTFKDSADPDMAIAAKNAGAVRRTITDAVEADLPPDVAGRWVEARTAYNSQYATPWRNLRSVVKRDVTPMQAFNRVFNPNDQATFRALVDVVGNSPAVRGKLQMGFLETLAQGTDGFQQAEAAHKTFNQMRPALAASGLFDRKELETLDLFLRRRELPTLMEKVRTVLDEPLTLKKGGVGTALGFFALHNPALAVTAMVGAGALPQLRRLAVLPAGSPAARRLATMALAKADQFAKALSKSEDPTPDDDMNIEAE